MTRRPCLPTFRVLSRLPLLLVLVLVACGGTKDDPILQLSAEEALEQGKQLMTEEKFRQARPYLIHAYEVEPNSRSGREGLLLAADALFFEGTSTSYIEAESRYRDFLNRFPTSTQADYAQYRIASCLAQRVGRPDRDQDVARDALSEYQDLVRLYPTSPYAARAREDVKEVTATLAEHEFQVGSFYLRFRLPGSAADRFRELLEKYPDYEETDKVLFHLCLAYEKAAQPDRAAEACGRLREEYPESRWVRKIPVKKGSSEDAQDATAAVATNGGL